mmetsp:Transcript_11110/g.27164  ORF Transcript_11110/g.27164 Transcript_11110/m.27164 type:complete len:234 (+) Transcript_11110:260-961(+)
MPKPMPQKQKRKDEQERGEKVNMKRQQGPAGGAAYHGAKRVKREQPPGQPSSTTAGVSNATSSTTKKNTHPGSNECRTTGAEGAGGGKSYSRAGTRVAHACCVERGHGATQRPEALEHAARLPDQTRRREQKDGRGSAVRLHRRPRVARVLRHQCKDWRPRRIAGTGGQRDHDQALATGRRLGDGRCTVGTRLQRLRVPGALRARRAPPSFFCVQGGKAHRRKRKQEGSSRKG